MPVNISHKPPCTKCGSTNVTDITLRGRKAYTRFLCGDCKNSWTVWHGQAAVNP